MNTQLNRKRCLSLARGGDFTHPGEKESIDIVMHQFTKDSSRQILDVGCGLGGTAMHIKDSGFGKPVCIDIEPDCIEYVNNSYPELETHICDVIDLHKIFKNDTFDLVYLFSSFYAFHDQQQSLKILSDITKPNGNLIIFEYLTDTKYKGPRLFSSDKNACTPIRKDNIVELLSNAGWQLTKLIDMTTKFIEWYERLISNLNNRKEFLISEIGVDAFEATKNNFTRVLSFLKSGELQGCIVYAKKSILTN